MGATKSMAEKALGGIASKRCFGLVGKKWNPDKGKFDKWPVNARTGRLAKVNDPSTWSSLDECLAGRKRFSLDEIGIFLSNENNLICLDIDHVLDPNSGKALAQSEVQLKKVVNCVGDTYIERSVSKNGLHVLFKGKMPGNRHRHGNFEMYGDKRFISLTFDTYQGNDVVKELHQSKINYLYQHFIVPQSSEENAEQLINNESIINDNQLLTLARADKKFDALFNGDWQKRYHSQSEADLAFCSLLAYWTHSNPERIDKIFRQSGLMRPKWDEQHGDLSYGQMTINLALQNTYSHYDPVLQDNSRTDEGVRNRFLRAYGDSVLYSYQQNCFLIFDGKKWVIDKSGQVSHLLDKIVKELKKESPECNQRTSTSQSSDNEELEKAIKQFNVFLNRYRNTSGKTAVLKQIQAYRTIDITIFDGTLKVINCDGILVNLETGNKRSVVPGDYVTKMIPVKPADTPTPVFDKFMRESFNANQELILFVMRVFGYALLGTQNAEQVMFIFYGPGANGKSILLNLMSRLFGDYSSHIQPAIISNNGKQNHDNNYNAQLADTYGARLMITSELEKSSYLDESTVKQLTGGEEIIARRLREQPIKFLPTAVLMMTTNYLPTVRGTDNGIWRRIVPIPMNHTVKADEIDPLLGDKLWEERQGILHKLILASQDYLQNGLVIPEICNKARQRYRAEMDTVTQFLEEAVMVTHNPNDKIFNSDLFQAFDEWNADLGTHLSHQGLSKELQRRGFNSCKSNGKHGRRGLKLKSEYQTQDYSQCFNGVNEIE